MIKGEFRVMICVDCSLGAMGDGLARKRLHLPGPHTRQFVFPR
jgi:hypothetical protein